jgi:hypothetical protein
MSPMLDEPPFNSIIIASYSLTFYYLKGKLLMILKRIAKGIKEQDWFVVMIEVMIVVVVIFIGLQVDDFTQSKKNNIQSNLFLQQLNLDIESDILSIKGAIEGHEWHIKNGKIAMRFLDGEDVFDKH